MAVSVRKNFSIDFIKLQIDIFYPIIFTAFDIVSSKLVLTRAGTQEIQFAQIREPNDINRHIIAKSE